MIDILHYFYNNLLLLDIYDYVLMAYIFSPLLLSSILILKNKNE